MNFVIIFSLGIFTSPTMAHSWAYCTASRGHNSSYWILQLQKWLLWMGRLQHEWFRWREDRWWFPLSNPWSIFEKHLVIGTLEFERTSSLFLEKIYLSRASARLPHSLWIQDHAKRRFLCDILSTHGSQAYNRPWKFRSSPTLPKGSYLISQWQYV